MLKCRLLVILFFVSLISKAQDRTIINESIIWIQYNVKTRLNEDYSWSFGAQYRSFLDRENGYHLFFTTGVTRKLDHGFSIGAGFTNLNINRLVDTDFVLVPELRPYQQVALALPVGKSRFSWKFMVEERFFRNAANGELIDGYSYLWRFRNKAGYKQYLSERWALVISSEIMFHAGDVTINLFDQHRTQFLLAYDFGKVSTHLGYTHWFFQTPTNRHENRHTLVIAFAHSI